MLGYIVPDKPELKMKEYELYTGYYCGICKSIAKRYGQVPRLVLNYDSVLLALVIASLFSDRENASLERCPVHPMKKRLIVRDTNGIDYAADMMLLLANFKLLDDCLDEGGIKANAGAIFLRSSYRKLKKAYPEKCRIIEAKLKELHQLEQENCASIDRAAEPFAKLMEEVFAADFFCGQDETERLLRQIGYHIGKWIYLIDAFDDIEENRSKGTYNPLLGGAGSQEDLEVIVPRVGFNLHYYLSELTAAWEQLKTEKNRALIDNIIYGGLLRKTEQILEKGTTKNDKSL